MVRGKCSAVGQRGKRAKCVADEKNLVDTWFEVTNYCCKDSQIAAKYEGIAAAATLKPIWSVSSY